MVFETQRLIVRDLAPSDSDNYYDMMSNPNVMSPIPRPIMSRTESDLHLKGFMTSDYTVSDTKIWAIQLKDNHELIGICRFLKNNVEDDEIGYRLREQFWRQGYGTEITKGLISYGFDVMNMTILTADVSIENRGSIKILDKFFTPVNDFFNPEDNCTDRRYMLKKDDWQH